MYEVPTFKTIKCRILLKRLQLKYLKLILLYSLLVDFQYTLVYHLVEDEHRKCNVRVNIKLNYNLLSKNKNLSGHES